MSYKPNPALESILKEKLKTALVDSAEILENKVKNNAPVKTGALRKSIATSTEDLNNLSVRVGTDIKYAPFVEFGTFKQSANPFFRSAVKESKNKMLAKFRNII